MKVWRKRSGHWNFVIGYEEKRGGQRDGEKV